MKKYSKNQLERFPIYLKYLRELRDQGVRHTSSPLMAEKLGYSQELIRKDLQVVCRDSGTPKVGRGVMQMIDDIETFLGYRKLIPAIVIGVGHLGGALLNYKGFLDMGMHLEAAFDNDPRIVGTEIGGKKVFGMSMLGTYIREKGIKIAVFTVPAEKAQLLAEQVVEYGVTAIWNWTPISLKVKPGIVVENVNLASSLAKLCHKMADSDRRSFTR